MKTVRLPDGRFPFSSLGARNASKFLLDELLTDTERIMIIKRLAALSMLSQGLSSYRVHKLLKMSEQTTARMKSDIKKNKYPHIASFIKKKKDKEQFWAELEVLVRFGMPEMGKNRWKWLDELYK